MENKDITFYLDPIVHSKLKEDQRNFRMANNESLLIKRIIVNYYPTYSQEKEDLENKIKEVINHEIQSYNPSNDECTNISWKIIKYLDDNKFKKDNDKTKRKLDKLHLRINKDDIVLESNIDSLASKARLSEAISSLINSYLSKPQYERERIIFQDVLEKLNKAISNNQQVKIKAKSNEREEAKFKIIEPKEIHVSREELFNYLLYKTIRDQKECATSIHLYNIMSVVPETKLCSFSNEINGYFKRMKRNGVQYSISDNTIYKIRLSEHGKKLYEGNLKYIERPVALDNSNKEEGIYYFDCSRMQLENYFGSFYEDAEILEPLEYRKDYYQRIANIYKLTGRN